MPFDPVHPFCTPSAPPPGENTNPFSVCDNCLSSGFTEIESHFGVDSLGGVSVATKWYNHPHHLTPEHRNLPTLDISYQWNYTTYVCFESCFFYITMFLIFVHAVAYISTSFLFNFQIIFPCINTQHIVFAGRVNWWIRTHKCRPPQWPDPRLKSNLNQLALRGNTCPRKPTTHQPQLSNSG